MNPDAGSMSEFPDSFEPLDVPFVPDVPRSGAAHRDPAIRPSPPRPGSRPVVRSRLIRAHGPRRRPRAPDPDIPQGSSRPVRGVGNRVHVKPPPSRLRRGKAGWWCPSFQTPSPNGGAAKQGVASADRCMRCPSATTGRRRGTTSLVAEAVMPALFWSELSETSPPSRVPVHMADESFCWELETTVLGELIGGGSAGGR
jgi:hypothetical protein